MTFRTHVAAALATATLFLATHALAAEAAVATQAGDVVVANHSPTHTTEFKIVSATGLVAFSAASNWSVLAMQSAPPVTATVFQIPDPADQGTPDSTNVMVRIYHTDTDQGRAGLAMIGKAYGAAPRAETYKGWKTFTSEPTHGATVYSLIDASRAFDDQKVVVGVRCAWPHLTANPAGYDATMLAACHALLDSVYDRAGPYTPAADEVVRRPAPTQP